MFEKSLSHARGLLTHSIGLSSSFPRLLAESTANAQEYKFHIHANTSSERVDEIGRHPGYAVEVFSGLGRAAHFHSARALLWQQDFSSERNECANVLQVGFIKLRPGTFVLALHNYCVTKPWIPATR